MWDFYIQSPLSIVDMFSKPRPLQALPPRLSLSLFTRFWAWRRTRDVQGVRSQLGLLPLLLFYLNWESGT